MKANKEIMIFFNEEDQLNKRYVTLDTENMHVRIYDNFKVLDEFFVFDIKNIKDWGLDKLYIYYK